MRENQAFFTAVTGSEHCCCSHRNHLRLADAGNCTRRDAPERNRDARASRSGLGVCDLLRGRWHLARFSAGVEGEYRGKGAYASGDFAADSHLRAPDDCSKYAVHDAGAGCSGTTADIPFWALAGLAFFLDRWRVPVLGTAFGILLLLNLAPQEHVFPVTKVTGQEHASLPTPSQLLERRLDGIGDSDAPLIIVAATGGGIHSAAWTAAVLAKLESESGGTFHKRLLLLSTVSGGSIAGMQFLREYERGSSAFSASFSKRMITAARCSSLQAVAWGVAYPDASRLVFPFLDWAFKDLQPHDRGWALERALHRKQKAVDCYRTMHTDGEKRLPADLESEDAEAVDASLTLNAAAKRASDDATYPAFVMNSTVVETGDRFRFSNYRVPVADSLLQGESHAAPPAAGFLEVFGRDACLGVPGADDNCHLVRALHAGVPYADVSLFTASRLSAALTYVSPAERIPYEFLPPLHKGGRSTGYHFVDGGYFDNDGVSSVVEFLASALAPCRPKMGTTGMTMDSAIRQKAADRIAAALIRRDAERTALSAGRRASFTGSDKMGTHDEAESQLCQKLVRHPLLFVEIRDSDDINTGESPDSFAHQANRAYDAKSGAYRLNDSAPGNWGVFQQLAAPPEAAISAGFESSTLRNRRELELLRLATEQRLDVSHVVIDYRRFLCNEKAEGDHACVMPSVSAGGLRLDWNRPYTWLLREAEDTQEKSTALSWHPTARQQDVVLGLRNEEDTCWRVQPTMLRHDGPAPSAIERIRMGLIWLESRSGDVSSVRRDSANQSYDRLCADPEQGKP